MLAIQVGETWRLLIDNNVRRVKVLAPAGTPGFWRCVDLETDLPFLAREEWFTELERASDEAQ